MTQKLFYLIYTIKFDVPYITKEWVRKFTHPTDPNDFWNALNLGWWQMQISEDY